MATAKGKTQVGVFMTDEDLARLDRAVSSLGVVTSMFSGQEKSDQKLARAMGRPTRCSVVEYFAELGLAAFEKLQGEGK
jgi:hypothetical protein